jgi:spore maturation protein SpmA
MITCFLTNWGVTIVLGLLLSLSEWLSKTKRTEANGILDFIQLFLRTVLRKGPKN